MSPRSSRAIGLKLKITFRISSKLARTCPFKSIISSCTILNSCLASILSTISVLSTRFASNWAGPSWISREILLRSSSWARIIFKPIIWRFLAVSSMRETCPSSPDKYSNTTPICVPIVSARSTDWSTLRARFCNSSRLAFRYISFSR
ncbi:hypothetical protein D3C77_512490 [compost metagenome]